MFFGTFFSGSTDRIGPRLRRLPSPQRPRREPALAFAAYLVEMTDTQRALLDQLMGKERNANLEDQERMKRHFWSNEVCKHFLVGIKPHELFRNTKSDLGQYKRIYDIRAKAEWDALSEEERLLYPYYWDTADYLKSLIEQVDYKINLNKQRIEAERRRREEAHRLTDEEAKRLGEIQDAIKDIESTAETLGEQGEVERALGMMTELSALRAERDRILKKTVEDSRGPGQKEMKVCEISGVLMSSTDSESRLQSLFSGKQYLGWKRVREFHSKLVQKLAGKSRPRPPYPHDSRADGGGARGRSSERRRRHDTRGSYGRSRRDSRDRGSSRRWEGRGRDSRRRRGDSRSRSRSRGRRYDRRTSRSRSRDRRRGRY